MYWQLRSKQIDRANRRRAHSARVFPVFLGHEDSLATSINMSFAPIILDPAKAQIKPSLIPSLDLMYLPRYDSESSAGSGRRELNNKEMKHILDKYTITTAAR